MKTEVKEIPFNGDTLLGVKDEQGQVWLAVKKSCINIGLTEAQAKAEVQKVQASLLFTGNWFKFKPVQIEGLRQVKREILMIHEKFVPMWLAQINLTPSMQKKNPGAVQKLLKYQLEAADILHRAFYETEENKDTFHNRMGLEGQIADLKTEMKDLKENVQTLIDNSTINMKQQKELYNLAKERICSLLGGKKSQEYKLYSKLYFQNLWGDIKRKFDCSGSYHDLNPKDYKQAKDFIVNWDYIA